MKSLIHLNVLCIGIIYVYGQGHVEHDHRSLSGTHIDTTIHHGNEQNRPAKLNDSGRNVRLNKKLRNKELTEAAVIATNLDRLLRKQSKQLLKSEGDRGKKNKDGRRGGRRRGRNRGNRRRTTTTTSTTTTTTRTTIAPKKSGGNSGITIIRTSRPNPFSTLGNVLRSAFNVRGTGSGAPLGSIIRPSVVGRPIFGGLFGGKR